MKKLLFFFMLFVIVSFSFSFDIYGGYNYVFTPDSTINSFFDASFDFPLSINNNTQFGLSLSLLSINTGVDNFFFSLMTYGRYDTKTSSGIFSVFGKGGAIFPLDFKLSSVGYGILAGIRYYFQNFFVGFSYEVIYLYDSNKIDALPIQFGYSF
jgi:hypothetical protein